MHYQAKIIIPLPIANHEFSYIVPNDMIGRVKIGCRVIVEFGSKRLLTGIVSYIEGNEEPNTNLKTIRQLLDEEPIFSEQNIRIWRQIATYYLCSIGSVMRAVMPSFLRLEAETIIKMMKDMADLPSLTDKEYKLIEVLLSKKNISISQADRILGFRTLSYVRSLVDKGVVETVDEIQETFRLPTVDFVKPKFDSSDQVFCQELKASLKRAKKQLIAIETIIYNERADNAHYSKKELATIASYPALRELEKKGLIEIYSKDIVSECVEGEYSDLHNLSLKQKEALADIKDIFKEKRTCLLHGYTGSGKTEIYSHLIKETLSSGKSVLMIVPEIGLTGQLVGRLQRWFPNELLVYHSAQSTRNKIIARKRILETETPLLIVGTRSSVFLPFRELGLVMIDEEHDSSLRQVDTVPHYSAKVVSAFIAQEFDSKILLGSATPSIETYAMAVSEKIGLVELSERYGGVGLPKVELINIKEMYHKKRMRGHFSLELIDKIEKTLICGQQVIIFQNRRGYSRSLSCEECGEVFKCKRCNLPLIYHKHSDLLRCHYCGYSRKFSSNKCSKCGGSKIDFSGFGTEQVEAEAKALFSQYRTARLDLDTAKGKDKFAGIIEEFENKEIDILVGTQIIAKGIDFSNVGLVAVLNADNLACISDYRAVEVACQTLWQIAGRAGRRVQGEVVCQTYDTEQEWLLCVSTNDYRRFFRSQMQERYAFHYPPYYKLLEVTFTSKNSQLLKNKSNLFVEHLTEKTNFEIIGPYTSSTIFYRNMYQETVLLKTPNTIPISSTADTVTQVFLSILSETESKGISIRFDIL